MGARPSSTPKTDPPAAAAGRLAAIGLALGRHADPADREPAVGGQAVMEGVMMRGPSRWAVAVRRAPNHPSDPGGIAIEARAIRHADARTGARRIPVLRGAVALVDSLAIGLAALRISAEESTEDTADKPTDAAWAVAVALGLGLAVGLFFLLPATLAKIALPGATGSGLGFVLLEKALRLGIFLGYLVAVARMPHLQRVFAYHGAEHKAIACHEAGHPLDPEHARTFSRLHPRCGTSFMLLVMLVSIVVLAPLGNLPYGWLLLSRIVGIPLIAGLAFELIRWTARHPDLLAARLIRWPGMQLQRLTTREPDDAQLEVALAALRAAAPELTAAAPAGHSRPQ